MTIQLSRIEQEFTNFALTNISKHWALPCASISELDLVQNLSYENKFDLQKNELVGATYFHMNSFARRLEAKGNSDIAH